MTTHIAAFYHFWHFRDYAEWQRPLQEAMQAQGLTGTILLAPEGINATIAGERSGIEALLERLRGIPGFSDRQLKWSESDGQPFGAAKVRLKRETITLGLQADAAARTGRHLSPEEWNTLLERGEAVLLDTRNAYETHLGSFRGAVDPKIDDFGELPGKLAEIAPDKARPVAMFCTGGIRCEKLSAWMLEQGWSEIYQLDGGILKYLEEVPEAQSRWDGACYVFDERVAVGHGLATAQGVGQCPACGHALRAEDRRHRNYIPAHACGFCA